MSLVRNLTEDEVRDGYTDKDGFHKGAKQILEFDVADPNVVDPTPEQHESAPWFTDSVELLLQTQNGIFSDIQKSLIFGYFTIFVVDVVCNT